MEGRGLHSGRGRCLYRRRRKISKKTKFTGDDIISLAAADTYTLQQALNKWIVNHQDEGMIHVQLATDQRRHSFGLMVNQILQMELDGGKADEFLERPYEEQHIDQEERHIE